MNARNGSNLHVILVAALVALLPLATYFGAYLSLTTRMTKNQQGGTCRVYRSQWVALAFLPATLIESALIGRDVAPAWPGPGP